MFPYHVITCKFFAVCCRWTVHVQTLDFCRFIFYGSTCITNWGYFSSCLSGCILADYAGLIDITFGWFWKVFIWLVYYRHNGCLLEYEWMINHPVYCLLSTAMGVSWKASCVFLTFLQFWNLFLFVCLMCMLHNDYVNSL